MSDLTTEQVLAMIQEAAAWRQPVNLRKRNLSDVDLSPDAIKQHIAAYPKVEVTKGGGVRLIGAHLEGANLDGACLREADLMDAHLERASLMEAHLEGCHLVRAHLEGAYLVRAYLDGAWLSSAHLEGANLLHASLWKVHFYGAYLDRTRFTRIELARRAGTTDEEALRGKPLIGEEADGWDTAKEAYLAIKQNFQSLGRYDDARWAYVKERQMERKSFFPSEAGDRWLAQGDSKRPGWLNALLRPLLWLRLLLWPRAPDGVHLDRPRWLRDLFWEGLALYGESIWRPLIWGLGIVFLWSLLFTLVGVEGAQGWADYLVFSLRSFATMAFNDLQPGNLAAKLLSAVEAMLGVSTLALVMFCLGRRMSGS